MKFDPRIKKLEKHFFNFHPKLDGELSEWFKSHPQYYPCAQPETNNMITMPFHLSMAFQNRIRATLKKKIYQINLTA